MNYLEIILKGMLLLVGVVFGMVVLSKKKSPKDKLIDGSIQTTSLSDSNDSPKTLDQTKTQTNPSRDWMKLYEEKCDLDQAMTRLAGGDTGMIAYKHILEKAQEAGSSKKSENIEMYRNSYKRKQQQLQISYQRYREILEEAKECPKEMEHMFLESGNEDIYQELLSFYQ